MTATRSSGRPCATRSPRPMSPPSDARPRADPERLHGALRAHHQGLLPRAPGPDRRGLAASRRPRVRRARPPRTESPGDRQSPDPAAVDGTATPWSRPGPPAARWDVARRLSVSSVIHDRPSTPRSRFWTVRRRTRRRDEVVRGAAVLAGWGRRRAGTACACCAGIVKLTKSSSINPPNTELQPVATPPCWASKTAVSPNLTIPARP